jgi:hypothetical protein
VDFAVAKLAAWAEGGAPVAWIVAGALVACGFVIFNALRVALYVPQLVTCWRDRHGCPTINLWTWGSWIAANLSTGLYMGIFLGDAWGLVLNLGNAGMCALIVAVTLRRRRLRRPPG